MSKMASLSSRLFSSVSRRSVSPGYSATMATVVELALGSIRHFC